MLASQAESTYLVDKKSEHLHRNFAPDIHYPFWIENSKLKGLATFDSPNEEAFWIPIITLSGASSRSEMRSVTLLIFSQLTCIISKPIEEPNLAFRGIGSYDNPREKLLGDFDCLLRSIDDVANDHEAFDFEMKQRSADLFRMRDKSAGIAPQPGHVWFWGFKLKTNGYLGSRLANFRQNQILEAKLRFFEEIQSAYYSLGDGNYGFSKFYLKRAGKKKERVHAMQAAQIEAKIPCIRLLESEHLNKARCEALAARDYCVIVPTEELITEQLIQLAATRKAMEQRWKQPGVAPEKSTVAKNLKRWLSRILSPNADKSRKQMAVRAAARAFELELFAHVKLKSGCPLLDVMRQIRFTACFRRRAEELRQLISDRSWAQIDLLQEPAYKKGNALLDGFPKA